MPMSEQQFEVHCTDLLKTLKKATFKYLVPFLLALSQPNS